MRTAGTLTLRGDEVQVNGFSVRDRSWGEARTEDPAGASGIHWLMATFGDDYAVHVTGLARWECDGRVGHGDSQVATWTDVVRAAFGDPP